MFHLTPQEKSALAGLLAVCLLGMAVHFALKHNFRLLRWTRASAQKIQRLPPDINTASAKILDKVPGIGPKTAQKIVDYRTQHGPFLFLEQLRKVKGLSKSNFEKIQKYYREAQTQ